MTAVSDARAQTFRSRSYTLNNFNRQMGWGPESRILLNTSSKKNLPVVSGSDRKISRATGKWRFRQVLPQRKPSGRLSSRRKVAISLGTSANRLWCNYYLHCVTMIFRYFAHQPHVAWRGWTAWQRSPLEWKHGVGPHFRSADVVGSRARHCRVGHILI